MATPVKPPDRSPAGRMNTWITNACMSADAVTAATVIILRMIRFCFALAHILSSCSVFASGRIFGRRCFFRASSADISSPGIRFSLNAQKPCHAGHCAILLLPFLFSADSFFRPVRKPPDTVHQFPDQF